jgi:hypothetical protein
MCGTLGESQKTKSIACRTLWGLVCASCKLKCTRYVLLTFPGGSACAHNNRFVGEVGSKIVTGTTNATCTRVTRKLYVAKTDMRKTHFRFIPFLLEVLQSALFVQHKNSTISI